MPTDAAEKTVQEARERGMTHSWCAVAHRNDGDDVLFRGHIRRSGNADMDRATVRVQVKKLSKNRRFTPVHIEVTFAPL